MKPSRILRLGVLGIIIFFFLSGTSRVFPQTPENKPKTYSLYVGLSASHDLSYRSEVFNGEYYLASEEEVMVLPKLKTSNGFNLFTGFRVADVNLFTIFSDLSMDFYLHRSSHDYTFPLFSLEGNSTLTELGLNFKLTFLKGEVIKPFISIGMSLAWLNVKDGSFSLSLPIRFGDASFNGAGGDLCSLGLDVFVSRKMFLTAAASYSSFGFWSVKGISGTSYDVKFGNKTLNVWYPKITIGIAFAVFQKEESH